MELDHEFTVPVPVDQAWSVLLDVERVALCMPGATLDSVDGEDYVGRLKVRLGAMTITYRGTARIVEADEAARALTIEGSGKEARGSGTASATIRARMSQEGDVTRVVVHTKLNVTGRPAQFGRNILAEVGAKLIARFATALAEELKEAPAPAERSAAAEAPTSAKATSEAPAKAASTTPAAPEAPAEAAPETSAKAAPGATPETPTEAAPAAPAKAPAEAASEAPAEAAPEGAAEEGVGAATGGPGAGDTAVRGRETVTEGDNLAAAAGSAEAAQEVVDQQRAAATAAESADATAAPAVGEVVDQQGAADAAAVAGPEPADAGHPAVAYRRERRADDAIDILEVAGPSVAKRLVPTVLSALAALLTLRYLFRRRRGRHHR
ncbi:Carbon monoxide dehydrogenase subunit G [Thermomonospora echinospora]|uniref:Carbon monoxide dehydrogenase subunit G n=1 Tax=Thermomonospora echinospora TaxID=1992 RepID=A0A1H5ZF72_9ACTN|nr:SRPBCC family protein [Thermomonospora echinospora]SEG34375.1 Carbon monoxide dehydrogenase subunit G [Thermomonospora echinospora]